MKFKFLVTAIILQYASFSQTKVKVIDFLKSECNDEYDIYRIQPQLTDKNFNEGVFSFSIYTVANCLGISMIKSDYCNDSLIISYRQGIVTPDTVTGIDMVEFADCECCFEFQFFIDGLSEEPEYIVINGSEFKYYPEIYRTYNVTFDILNNDTINYTDKYGFKQGKWNRIKNPNDIRFKYYSTYDSVYYDAYYKNDTAYRSILKAYYTNGQIAVSQSCIGENNIKFEKYDENGNLISQVHGNGYKLGTVRTKFYETGGIEYVEIMKMGFSETLIYYENGHLKEIRNLLVRKLFYPNGKLKMEDFIGPYKNNISSKYYYDNGNIMAIEYIEKTENGFNVKKRWEEYFDINGKNVSKDYLIKEGYENVLYSRFQILPVTYYTD